MPWEYMSLVMSSDNIVMSLWAEWPRNWFDCWQEQGIFLFSNHAHQLWVRSHPGSYLVGGMKLTTYHILHGSIHPLPLMPSWCGTTNAFDVFHFLDCMENFPMVVPLQFFSSVWVWAIYSVFYHIMVFWVATPCSIHLFQHFRGTCCLHLQVGMNLVQVVWWSECIA